MKSALVLALAFCLVGHAQGFVGSPQSARPFVVSPLFSAKVDSSSLLDEFRLYNGELVNPYKVLKVNEKAERSEIRKNYVDLSKRYHPDARIHRDILPGSW